MRSRIIFAVAACGWFIPQVSAAAPEAANTANAAQYRAVLDKYCVGCHNDRVRTGGLTLQTLDLAQAPAHADVLEKVIRKVHGGMMPPVGLPRPDQPTADGMVTWLRATLDKAAVTHPYPGRPLLQRLNRSEYANAIRDLLALDVDVSALLPPDNSGYGFDNVTDVLGVSPMLLESYLTAAGKIATLAIGDPKAPPSGDVYHERQDASQDKHIEGLPLGTIGGMAIKVTLPADGEYLIEPRLFRTNLGTMRGLENSQQLEVAVDGARVHIAAFGGNEEVAKSSANPTTTGNSVNDRLKVRVPLKSGPHTITVAFIERSHVQNTWRLKPFLRSSADTIDFGGYPHLDTVTVTGPFNPTGVSDSPSRAKIFVCRPASTGDEAACAKTILATLVRRAYRGQSTDEDLQRLLEFYQTGRKEGGSFDQGISLALRRMLSSPKFTFRVERDPEGPPGMVYKVSDLELASRLSFFLWSSIPAESSCQSYRLHGGRGHSGDGFRSVKCRWARLTRCRVDRRQDDATEDCRSPLQDGSAIQRQRVLPPASPCRCPPRGRLACQTWPRVRPVWSKPPSQLTRYISHS